MVWSSINTGGVLLTPQFLLCMRATRSAGRLAYFSRSEPWKLFVDRVYMPREKQAEFVQQHPAGIRVHVGKVSGQDVHPNLLEQQLAGAARMEYN